MGYFSRLQKCARYRSSDTGEYMWGAWKNTGSVSSGVDYVSSDGLAVVYRADVVYDSTDSALENLAVATNFVNPKSSGNPSTARCYLYTSDPTGGGNAEISTAPAGSFAISEIQEFNASNVGDYLIFRFTSLGIKPSAVYFWFTSSGTYASYGSNQIYHYATGNWNSSWQTGTRTPAVAGTFTQKSGSGGGGGDSGGGDSGGGTEAKYTLVASGTYSSIYSGESFEISRAESTASYTALKFSGSGKVSFSGARTSGDDSTLVMDGYLTRTLDFDAENGMPTGEILASDVSRDSYSFEYSVTAGQTYYLWTVIHRSGYSSTPVTVNIAPRSWSFTIADKGTTSNIAQSAKSFSMSMNSYQVGRMKLSFDYTATVDISAAGSPEDSYSSLWFSEQSEIDSSTGQPTEWLARFYAGESDGYLKLEKGKTYYVFAMYSAGETSGSVSFTITPPEKRWSAGDSASCSLISADVTRMVSLNEGEYSLIELSFDRSGNAQFYTSGTALGDGQYLEIYLTESDNLDSYYGDTEDYLARDSGAEKSPDCGVTYDVIAGKTYYLIVKNGDADGTGSTVINIVPPDMPYGYTLIESSENTNITSNDTHESGFRQYTIARRRLRFKYRGTAKISAARGGGGTPKTVKLYLTDSEGLDLTAGEPTGNILGSAEVGSSGAELSLSVTDRTDYYVFLVVPQIYYAAQCQVSLSTEGPAAQYFSVTETAEYYMIDGKTIHAAAPGTSGVVRLELSFKKSGLVYFKTANAAGQTDFLKGWLGLSPYLNERTGEPYSDILASGSGSADGANCIFSVPVEAGTTYYLFTRDDWLYASPDFDIYIKPVPGVVRMRLNGQERSAAPYIYTLGAWRAAVPEIYADGAWRTGA